MKSIIDGLRYNTEAPKTVLIGEYRESCGRSDFNYWEAGLYVTGGGRYFIAGNGGPMTRFSRPEGTGGLTGGEKVIPMSKDEAFDWAQRYLDTETVGQWFFDMIEEA